LTVHTTNKSLLVRAQCGEAAAWERLTAIYRPMIFGCLLNHGVARQETEDLTQDILLTMVRKVRDFEHSGRIGSFRAWLRVLTLNRVRKFWQSRSNLMTPRQGQTLMELSQSLEDPDSDLAREWDLEHDRHVYRRLLEIVSQDFEPTTICIFRRMVIENASGPEVALELNMSLAAVYGAKARVMKRLREESEGLLG
jgi:RNA polymerase sigma-70 factor (ECF subfamily)